MDPKMKQNNAPPQLYDMSVRAKDLGECII